MSELNIVVVGPGLIGAQHIRLINAHDNCNLVAIVAPNHGVNWVIAQKENVPLFHSLEECISKTKIDGVIISSPNEFHAAQARLCIMAHIPVLIEKPVAATVAEAEALLSLARDYDAKVLVGHHRAHSPLLARAREIIRSGRLGRLVSVIGSAQFFKPSSYFDTGPWRTRPGGGPILINLIHEVGNLRSLCGEIVAVQALSSSALRGYAVEDSAAINLMFENGALGTFMLSDTAACARSWEQTSRENPTYPNYPDEDCYVVAGTRGYLSIPTFRLKYYSDGIEPSWWAPFTERTIDVDRREPLTCQLAHFLQVIRGEADPLVSAADGLRNLRVTEAIGRAAIERRLIEV